MSRFVMRNFQGGYVIVKYKNKLDRIGQYFFITKRDVKKLQVTLRGNG